MYMCFDDDTNLHIPDKNMLEMTNTSIVITFNTFIACLPLPTVDKVHVPHGQIMDPPLSFITTTADV